MSTIAGADVLPLLTIRRFDCDGVTVLSLAGEIDMSNASRLEAAVELNTDARLVIDLSEVTFIDSSGLHTVLKVNERHSDGTVAICGSEDGAFKRLLTTVGLDGVVQVYPTQSAAIAQVRVTPIDDSPTNESQAV